MNVAVQFLAALLCFWEIPGSIFGLFKSYTCFPQSCQYSV